MSIEFDATRWGQVKEVACLGGAVADIVVKPVDGLPNQGALQKVDTIQMHTGGCALNTAIDRGKS